MGNKNGVRIFTFFLTSGMLYSAGMQFSSPNSTLLYVFAETDAPPWLVGSITPASIFGAIIGTFLSPPIVNKAQNIKLITIFCVLIMATLLFCTALVILYFPDRESIYLTIILCIPFGATAAISSTAFSLYISSLFNKKNQDALNILQLGLGSLVVTIVTTYSLFMSNLWNLPSISNLNFVWIGSVAMGTSAGMLIAAVKHHDGGARIVSEPGSQSLIIYILKVRENSPVIRYILTQAAFCSIVLSPVFFGIYSIETLNETGSVDQNLLFIGIGTTLGMIVWIPLKRRLRTRSIYMISATLPIAGSLVYLFLVTTTISVPSMLLLGALLSLCSFAIQPLYSASYSWLISISKEEQRLMIFSFTGLINKITLIVCSFAFGLIAGYGPSNWPIYLLLISNFTALGSSFSVPNIENERKAK